MAGRRSKADSDKKSGGAWNESCSLKVMIALNHPDGQSYPTTQKPGHVAFGQIVVTRGNPSRGKGFEVSHFIRRNGMVRSLSELDIFLPSMRKAASWVHRYYPEAKLVTRRKDHFGRLAALSFECSLRDMVPGTRMSKRSGKNGRGLAGQSPAR